MMTYLAALLTWRNFINLIDILVIWFLIYELMVLVRGTRAVQLFKGIIIIIVVKLISWYIGLTTVSWVMDQIINWGVIAMVVIFQPEIRRGLEHLGRGTMFTRTKTENEEEEALITQLDQAIQYMSKRRIGALIAIEMDTGLEEYIETGIPLDAEVTGALLINTFIPNTPLHDGAVIIKGGRIAVAAAYLPLSDSKLIPKELGTRHRAAVGISEVTDALTIVISEETGGVSITKDNELIRDMTQENYLKFLRAHLYKKESTDQNKLLDRLVNPFRKG
ncbi:diadenylate cyclase CdaA [Limosilactobacillus fermentum]|nr:diadenylate cyclase CdaA [Limosilactobacillus fermentum]MBM9560146.1 diadenylate cyclase CdaA [Limosilactobacillus fermentum]MCD5424266.1 diadenylate cyclase CdaA [Limosilactobacillus fermentum]MDC6079058.1 diadenylate cyclase CdaA [Limosilactobacillus fermentum]MDF4006435.1 diadenylate cyclase CdaA [Limosilactobacillus fermentum]MDF4015335.1 diadenylate cyclase CdaA [Limosilactobacillus fermentum]